MVGVGFANHACKWGRLQLVEIDPHQFFQQRAPIASTMSSHRRYERIDPRRIAGLPDLIKLVQKGLAINRLLNRTAAARWL